MTEATGIQKKLGNSNISYLKIYTPLAVACALLYSGLYLYQYWEKFEINAFEYANSGNIFILATPYLVGGAIFLFCFILSAVIVGDVVKTIYTASIKDRLIKVIGYVVLILPPVYLLLGLLLHLLQITGLYWGLFCAISGGFWGIFIMEKMKLFSEITDSKIRRCILFFIVAMIPISWHTGAIRAETIISGRSYYYTEYCQKGENIPQKIEQKFRYIGTLGDYIFLYEPEEKGTVMTTISNAEALQIHKWPAR